MEGLSLRIDKVFGRMELVGRPSVGFRKFGVPPGGPLDTSSFEIANALVGRPLDSPVYELLGSAILEAEDDLTLGVVGADAVVAIEGHESRANGSFHIRRGQRVQVTVRRGFATYLAMGEEEPRRLADDPESLRPGPFRVLSGPHASDLNLLSLLGTGFQATMARDRVGIRLSPSLAPHSLELTSEPACVGTIQVTNAGVPIVLGPDGPTIGGYPKIAVVAEVDHDRLGQIYPGSTIVFEQVCLEEARRLLAEKNREQSKRIAELCLGKGSYET